MNLDKGERGETIRADSGWYHVEVASILNLVAILVGNVLNREISEKAEEEEGRNGTVLFKVSNGFTDEDVDV